MADAEKIRSDFEETIRPYFSKNPDRVSIISQYGESHDALANLFVSVIGDGISIFGDVDDLRDKISGEFATKSDRLVVINGTHQGCKYSVMVISTPLPKSKGR